VNILVEHPRSGAIQIVIKSLGLHYITNTGRIVIVHSELLKRPHKRSRWNQLIHRHLTKTKSMDRGQDQESQTGRQLNGYDGYILFRVQTARKVWVRGLRNIGFMKGNLLSFEQKICEVA